VDRHCEKKSYLVMAKSLTEQKQTAFDISLLERQGLDSRAGYPNLKTSQRSSKLITKRGNMRKEIKVDLNDDRVDVRDFKTLHLIDYKRSSVAIIL
jgi:hypothetical protein